MKRLFILALILAVACISPLYASTIKSININDVSGAFTTGSGQYNLGVLSFADTANIVIEDNGSQQTTIDNVTFALEVSLFEDNSANGIVNGQFKNGSFEFLDSAGTSIISGNNLELLISEPFDNMGMLSGIGTFEVTDGTLAANFGATLGQIFQVSFGVTPKTISDFSQDFSSRSNITITPLPEPLTLAFLSIGGFAMLTKRKN